MSNSQDFPQNWNSVDLAKVAQVIDPHPSHRAPDEERDGIPFAGIGDLNDQGELVTDSVRRVSQHVLVEHAIRYTLSGNSIGFGRVASIGKVINFQDDVSGIAISPTMAVVEPKSIDRNYLIHALQSNFLKEQIERLLTGTTRSSLGIELLRKLRIPIPVDREPEQIGLILTTLDTAIRRTEALIAKYQQIKAGLMHDLFTRGVTPDGHLRPTRVQAPHLYKESPLGWIPKEWEVVPLSSVSQFITSGSRGWAEYYSEIGPLFIRIGNLTREHINFRWDSVTRVSLPKFTEGQRTAVLPNDILISITADLGIVAVADDGLGEAYVNQHIALVRPRVAPGVSRFLGHFLSTVSVQKQFLRLNDSGAKAGLNLPAIGKILVGKPLDDVEAKGIAAMLDEADQSIECHKREVAKLRQQKHGLMHDLLTGRVRVKVSESASA